MAYVDFLSSIHKKTKRDYVARVLERPKGEVAEIAKKFDYDYWDGDRSTGYGGYHYDGRWEKVAREMVDYYGINPGDRILDSRLAHLLIARATASAEQFCRPG